MPMSTTFDESRIEALLQKHAPLASVAHVPAASEPSEAAAAPGAEEVAVAAAGQPAPEAAAAAPPPAPVPQDDGRALAFMQAFGTDPDGIMESLAEKRAAATQPRTHVASPMETIDDETLAALDDPTRKVVTALAAENARLSKANADREAAAVRAQVIAKQQATRLEEARAMEPLFDQHAGYIEKVAAREGIDDPVWALKIARGEPDSPLNPYRRQDLNSQQIAAQVGKVHMPSQPAVQATAPAAAAPATTATPATQATDPVSTTTPLRGPAADQQAFHDKFDAVLANAAEVVGRKMGI